MSIKLYDEAIYNKIKNWVMDPKMRILKPDEVKELFQTEAFLNNDKVELPLIALSRDRDIYMNLTTKRSLSFDGKHISSGKDGEKTLQLNAIPFSTIYQIDIYTYYEDECLEYVRNFIFNLTNHPRLKIEMNYNGARVEHVANIKVDNTASDTSDIPERLFKGQFTRWTIRFELQDAYFFNTPAKENWHLDTDAELYYSDDIEVEDEGDLNTNGFTHISEKEI